MPAVPVQGPVARALTSVARISPRWLQVLIGALTALALDLSSKFLAYAIVDEPTPLVAPSRNEEIMFGLTQPGTSLLLTTALAVVTLCVLTHAVVLWRRGSLPGVVLGVGFGSIAANLIDRVATGVVHDWISIRTMSWNLADFGILLFVAFYALCALRTVPGDAGRQAELVRAVSGERTADNGIGPASSE
jgi:lipoprotein signal peptidase